MAQNLSLVVFDLDFTLWDCGGLWVDCTSPPYRSRPDGTIVDSSERIMRLYSDVPEILDEVEAMGCQMALASRTDRPEWARQLLDLMGYRDRFEFEEIFPASKVAHFTNLKNDTGIPFEEMLFFDDENRNIVEVGELGVKCVELKGGISRMTFEKGLAMFG